MMRFDLARYIKFIARNDPELYNKCFYMFSDFLDEVEKDMQKEMVNHPDHYQGQNGIECIDAIEAALTPEEFRGFLKGTSIRYIWRAGKKPDNPPAQDFRKAAAYIEKLI